MSQTQYDIPNISIDTVPVFMNTQDSKLHVVLGKRQFEPFQNEFALPGVLLNADERLNEAAGRALASKTLLFDEDIRGIFDLGTFDNPNRDPRGATVSIAKIVVVESREAFTSDQTTTVTLDDASDANLYQLPFDHNNIVRSAAVMISEKLLHNKEFTRALIGDQFTTSSIRNIYTQIASALPNTEAQIDFSNLGRALKATGWVTQQATGTSAAYSGLGRPSRQWAWN